LAPERRLSACVTRKGGIKDAAFNSTSRLPYNWPYNMTQQEITPGSIHVLSVGSFGRAVAHYLIEFGENISETEAEGGPASPSSTWQTARINILAAWRPVPRLCEMLDQLSFEWQRPFLPVVLDSTALRVGPAVVPGSGPCWGCWVRRSMQHADSPKEQAALLRHYAENAADGPRGFLEPFAMMAATRALKTIEALESSIDVAGYIWQIDILTRNITSGTLVGVHDCPRCGMHRPALTRSYAELQEQLRYLWPDAPRAAKSSSRGRAQGGLRGRFQHWKRAAHRILHSAARWPQPKRDSPRSPSI
jgi:bacteriocin biosynthesis cyclodehydratase domain-containing protein